MQNKHTYHMYMCVLLVGPRIMINTLLAIAQKAQFSILPAYHPISPEVFTKHEMLLLHRRSP